MKGFYVYENWGVKNVKIHKGKCAFCNNGQGIGRNIHGNLNGQWHLGPNNPFLTYSAARQFASRCANQLKTQYQNCKRCNPQL